MSRRSTLVTLLLVAASTPGALGLEALIRRYLLSEAMTEFREWLRPQLTPWAWGLVVLAAVSVLAALAVQPRVYASALRRQRSGTDAERAERARFETLMIVTSIPQIPALLATALSMFGAVFEPIALTVGVGTVGVLVQWLGSRSKPA